MLEIGRQRDRLEGRIERGIAAVVEHGRFIMGPEVQALEERLTEYTGARHVVTCGSGTDALLLVLLAWGIGPGDAVYVPGFTFAATAEVVALVGATPVFVDVRDDFNMDPVSLAEAVVATDALRPAAVIPVDLFGLPASYPELEAVAARHDMRILADAAQSLGATLGGDRVGTLAAMTATSFFPAKPLGCYGDGGAVFTDDPDGADVLRSLRFHGRGTEKYDNARVGTNARLDTIQAAVLLEKLTILDEEVAARAAIAARYDDAFRPSGVVPARPSGPASAWAQYTIRAQGRDDLAASLRAALVESAVYYPRPLHRQTAYAGQPCAPRGLPISEAMAGDVLSLPSHAYLTASEQERVVDTVMEHLDRWN
jgi:dTDP-4-amino-4,6-dideoxygalactose transaminase